MFISDTKDKTAEYLRSGLRYLTASLIIALAAAVYGLFSHGVYSYYMTYAFMIPLLGGAIPNLNAALNSAAAAEGIKKGSLLTKIRESKNIQIAVIVTLTVGSLLKGALDIYGTTNKLLIAYPVLAIMLIGSSAISAKGAEN